MADLRTIGWFMLILYKPNGGLPTILLKPCSPSLRPRCCFTDIHQLLKHADATDGGISILGVHEAWALTTGQPTHEAQEEQNVDPEERITCQAAAAGVSSRRLIIADGDGIASPSEGLFLGETVLSLFRFDVCQLSAGVKACIFSTMNVMIAMPWLQPATTTATPQKPPKESMAPDLSLQCESAALWHCLGSSLLAASGPNWRARGSTTLLQIALSPSPSTSGSMALRSCDLGKGRRRCCAWKGNRV